MCGVNWILCDKLPLRFVRQYFIYDMTWPSISDDRQYLQSFLAENIIIYRLDKVSRVLVPSFYFWTRFQLPRVKMRQKFVPIDEYWTSIFLYSKSVDFLKSSSFVIQIFSKLLSSLMRSIWIWSFFSLKIIIKR